MHKVVVARPGHYDRLEVVQAKPPPLEPGSVRIGVEAAGVNYADCVVRMGLYKSAREYVGWPITPGFEVAGEVTEVASDVQGVAVGDRVIAVTRFGGYASQVVVPAWAVFSMPAGWTAAQAAGFPAVHLTAYYALCELAGASSGSRLLVHSAAGGVGSVLVQLGVHRGCEVVGVVGAAHKVAHVEALGASVVIDKSSRDLWHAARAAAPEGFDAVFDANGVETLAKSYDHVAPTGRLIIYGFATMLPRGGKAVSWLSLAWNFLRTPRFSPLKLTNDNRSVMGFNLSYMFDQRDLLHRSMTELLRWAQEGIVGPPTTRTYPLSDVASAHRDLESGQTIGKLVLLPEA